MIAEFSFIIIRGGATLHDKQNTMDFLYAVLRYMDGNEIMGDEFDASYDMIPRVVIQHSESLREIEDKIAKGTIKAEEVSMKEITSEKDFTQHSTGQESIMNIKKKVDPRYGIIDAHAINTEAGNVLAINIAINTMMDMRVKTWLNSGLARRLNVGKSHDVVAIVGDPMSSQQLEFYEMNSLQSRKHGRSMDKSTEGSALNEYRTETGIDINKVLKSMDTNVDIKDAPTTMRDIDQLLMKMKSSVDFMEKMGFDKPSVEEGKKEVREILSVRDIYVGLSGKDSTMTSIYFRMNSPDKVRMLIDSTKGEKLLEIDGIKNVGEV